MSLHSFMIPRRPVMRSDEMGRNLLPYKQAGGLGGRQACIGYGDKGRRGRERKGKMVRNRDIYSF